MMKRFLFSFVLLFPTLSIYSNLVATSTDPLLKKECLSQLEKLISKEEIDQKIKEVAKIIERDFNGEALTMVLLMKGAICIGADLLRQINLPCVLEYIKASSYGAKGSKRGELIITGLEQLSLEGKNVLIVDDIFDTGITMATVDEKIRSLHPKKLKSLVLLTKNVEHSVAYVPDYSLFTIENRFVVGYGLDYKELWRGLPDVCAFR